MTMHEHHKLTSRIEALDQSLAFYRALVSRAMENVPGFRKSFDEAVKQVGPLHDDEARAIRRTEFEAKRREEVGRVVREPEGD